MCANNILMVIILTVLASFGITFFTVASNSEPARPEEPIGISEIGGAVITSNLIIENVSSNGGLEVFNAPDRESGREFAAAGNFQPHVAGITAEGDWLYIYYFDNGVLTDGWVPTHQLVLNAEEVASLAVVYPNDLLDLPDLEFNELAARPYGTNAPELQATIELEATSETSNDNGGGSDPASTQSPTDAPPPGDGDSQG